MQKLENNYVKIYTDGACLGNPGPGGWAAILIFNGVHKELFGSENFTTNNKMELTAIVKALAFLKKPCKVVVYSDSSYIVNCFKDKWYKRWLTNGWQKADGKRVENKDLWEQLLNLVSLHDVSFVKVKGHSNNFFNNRCDFLAKKAIKKF